MQQRKNASEIRETSSLPPVYQRWYYTDVFEIALSKAKCYNHE